MVKPRSPAAMRLPSWLCLDKIPPAAQARDDATIAHRRSFATERTRARDGAPARLRAARNSYARPHPARSHSALVAEPTRDRPRPAPARSGGEAERTRGGPGTPGHPRLTRRPGEAGGGPATGGSSRRAGLAVAGHRPARSLGPASTTDPGLPARLASRPAASAPGAGSLRPRTGAPRRAGSVARRGGRGPGSGP